jgi:hypothetical protein
MLDLNLYDAKKTNKVYGKPISDQVQIQNKKHSTMKLYFQAVHNNEEKIE